MPKYFHTVLYLYTKWFLFKVSKLAIFNYFGLFLPILGYLKFSNYVRTLSWYVILLSHTFLYLYKTLSLFKVSKIVFLGHFGLFLAYFQVPKIFILCLNTIRVCNSSLPNIFIYFYSHIRHCHSSKSQIWLFWPFWAIFSLFSGTYNF